MVDKSKPPVDTGGFVYLIYEISLDLIGIDRLGNANKLEHL